MSPRLAVTVRRAAAADDAVSGAGFPRCDDARGGATASLTGTRSATGSSGETSAIESSTGGHKTTAAVDGFSPKLSTLEVGDDCEQLTDRRPVKLEEEKEEEEAAEKDPTSFSGGVPLLPEATTPPTTAAELSDRRLFGGGADDAAGETEALSNVFGEAETQEEGGDFEVVVEVQKAIPREERAQKKQGRGGDGGLTQVLSVPEFTTRDTEEFLGIQVR